jgi:uncharacterized protein (TIGR03083 family)
MPLPVTDTRSFFRPLSRDMVAVLRGLSADAWNRPTMAPGWRVRDVAAHLVDTALRRLSYHRDAEMPPRPADPVTDERSLAAHINALNATWVQAAARFSPRVVTDLYDAASLELATFFEQLPSDAPALFPVSWAGDLKSAGWFDIGREFTEVWHHGAQIRDAVGAGPFPDARWLRAVLAVALHVLPHAYRCVHRTEASVVLEITGRAAGTWSLQCRGERWDVSEGDFAAAATRVTMGDEVAWRVWFNAIPLEAAERMVRIEGDAALARPLLAARSVIV